MGSMITLGIGCMEIDWGKNNVFSDHSSLFKTTDVKLIPYYYVDMDTDEPIIEMKEGYERKLSSVKRRLDLLGYNMTSIRKMYKELLYQHENYGYDIQLSFDAFCEIVKSIDISKINTAELAVRFETNGYNFGEYFRRCVLEEPELKEKLLAGYREQEDVYRRQEYAVSEFLENMDPYITLRILAENPDNGEQMVRWNFADIVEGGWARREEIVKELAQEKRILIVTEGSSDSYILSKAIEQLFPDISDFFEFVDMKENYPFTGTGNLYNFCMGLCRINIQNNIIVIFDNDTAGVEKYEKSLELKKPASFAIMKLPDYPEFSNVCTIGPHGKTMDNINGKAVAIECFLDFECIQKIPCIRWTTYNKNQQKYQGELECKDEYVRVFKTCNLAESSYDTSKLKYLVSYIIDQWINLNQEDCM